MYRKFHYHLTIPLYTWFLTQSHPLMFCVLLNDLHLNANLSEIVCNCEMNFARHDPRFHCPLLGCISLDENCVSYGPQITCYLFHYNFLSKIWLFFITGHHPRIFSLAILHRPNLIQLFSPVFTSLLFANLFLAIMAMVFITNNV